MILAFWNVRGLSTPQKQREVLNFVRKNDIDVIGLLETKLTDKNFQFLVGNVFVGLCHVSNFDVHRGSRILVLWNPNTVLINKIGSHEQVINCEVSSRADGQKLISSFVYGHNRVSERRYLWQYLESFSSQSTLPWAIMGDFNTVFSEEEKVNGCETTTYELRDPLDFCLQCRLTELSYSGCKFTWTNGRVKTRLDRVLVNDVWLDSFTSSSAYFPVSRCTSDHSPGIVFLAHMDSRPRVNFKFFNMWAQHPDFLSLVKDAWEENCYGSKMYIVYRKLK